MELERTSMQAKPHARACQAKHIDTEFVLGDLGISIKPRLLYSEFVRGLCRFSVGDDSSAPRGGPPGRPRVGHHPAGGEAEAVAN